MKQLSADADFGHSDTIDHYNMSEAVAEAFFNHGIAAVFALKSGANYLQIIENVGYLVHPWSCAVALNLSQISEQHALKIARLLAKMHRADIVDPGLSEPQFDLHPEDRIIELVYGAEECNLQIAQALKEELPTFLAIAEAQKEAVWILAKHVVISHGDLNQKNVLWDAGGNPSLIDWESARKLSPTYEIVNEALDWSGITSQLDHGLFEKIILAYKQAGGVIEYDSIQASFDCILGDWVNWLMYNVGRCIYLDEEERTIGKKQVYIALPTILQLNRELPGLLSMAGSGPAKAELGASCLI